MKLAIGLLMVAAFVSANPQKETTATETKEEPASDKSTDAAAAAAPETTSTNQRKIYTRFLPADVLRDFPGLCFASTMCRVYNVGEFWPLTPFCGRATCLSAPNGSLIERVEDCGPLPKDNKDCELVNADSTKTAPFPDCCPKFECKEGVELEYPTPQEIQEGARTPSES